MYQVFQSDIIEKHGSVKRFKEVEVDLHIFVDKEGFLRNKLEENDDERSHLVENYRSDNLKTDIVFEYELEYETHYGDWGEEYKNLEEYKGFDLIDGIDRKLISKVSEEYLIKDKTKNWEFNEGNWNQLGLDLGLIKEDK